MIINIDNLVDIAEKTVLCPECSAQIPVDNEEHKQASFEIQCPKCQTRYTAVRDKNA